MRLPPTIKGKRIAIPKERRTSYGQNDWLLKKFAEREALELGVTGYVIKLWPSIKFDAKIKHGIITRIYFTHTVKAVDIRERLQRLLLDVKRLRETQPGKQIELYYGLKDRSESVRKQFDSVLGVVNGMLRNEEVEEKIEHVVSVRHRETGLIVTRSCKFGDISKSLVSARVELTELVKLVIEKAAIDNAAKESVISATS